MKTKRFFVSILSALILIATLVTTFAVTGAAIGVDYDYSRPGSSLGGVVDSKDILEYALSSPLTDAEREYLALHGKLNILYDKGISTSLIVTEYDGADLTVFASKYTYFTASGNAVSFVPELCEYNGVTMPLVAGLDGYSCVFASVSESDGDIARITYSLSLDVKSRDVNKIINQAYLDAPALKERLEYENEKYLLLKQKYDSDLASYEEYLEAIAIYEEDLIEYTEYLAEKKMYEDALFEYNKYLCELEAYEAAVEDYAEYNEKLASYNLAYSSYRDYLDELAVYEERLDAYNLYLERLQTVRAQLSVIDTAKVNMTDERQVYSAIMGNLVTQVLTENKDILISDLIGADKAVIEAAELATENLRILLPYYFSLESEQDKYAYYTINYEAFRDSFKSLAEALDVLYQNKRIKAEIKRQGRERKYVILVAQLVLLTNGLFDGKAYNKYTGVAFDSKFKIDGQSVSAILEGQTYFTDTDTAAPLKTGYPHAMAEPVAPDVVEEPIKPTRVQIPAYPEEVLPPEAEPEQVDEPTAPEEISAPGDAPVMFEMDSASLNLIEAYENGLIAEREEIGSDVSYKISVSVSKRVFGSSLVSVVFRDSDGGFLSSTEIDKGSFAVYDGAVPLRAEDASASYTFIGWTDVQGSDELFDLGEVSEDAVLYPVFRKNPKSYIVTFNVGDSVFTESFVYGETAVFEGTPAKPSAQDYDYRFVGWDEPLGAVLADAEYTAIFERAYLVRGQDASLGARITDSGTHLVAEAQHLGAVLDAEGALSRAVKEGKGLVLVSSRGTVTVSYTNAVSMLAASHTVFEVKTVQTNTSGYRYRVTVADSSGSEGAYRLSVNMPCLLGEDGHMSLYYFSAEGRVAVSNTYNGDNISFALTTGIDYHLEIDYELTVLESKHAAITVIGDTTSPGSLIYVNVEPIEGVSLIRIYLVLSDGTEVPVEGGSFRMPKADASLGVVCREDVYSVTFIDGDRIISAGLYKYGEVVVPPSPPSRLNDSRFSYTFERWSPVLDTVTEDVTYHAVYKLELLPKESDDGKLKISESVKRLIALAVVGACMLLFVVAPSGIIAVIKVRKYRQIFARKSDK